MATNVGEVRVTLTASSRVFLESIRIAVREIRILKNEARDLNRSLQIRARLPLRGELSSITAQIRELRNQANTILQSFPSALPPNFRSSLNDAQRQLASIRREAVGLGTSFNNAFSQASTEGAQAFQGATRGARNLRTEIDRGNRSITLMVAKFALLVFAVQTVANIIDSTFGAALRSIDDFEQGIIGTAAAITNLADLSAQPGATLADAFQQNLAFVRGAFQELEVIAGNFFSSATDLQLAFNTLAARGVVIRREEFTLLGAITDQIKIQTRGQVSSIQIAQELRNLFNGQVRAADQLAQLIRAQGGDVQEIARQLRETGSLEPLRPFVSGLLEALGVIQTLLLPQLVRFQATVEQITRIAFADVFTGTVDILRNINDFLGENRARVGAIANIVISRIGTAFQVVLDILKVISPILGVIAGSLLVKIVALAIRFGAVLTNPVNASIALVGIITNIASKFEILRNIGLIAFEILRLVFNLLIRQLDVIINGIQKFLGALARIPIVASALGLVSKITDEVGAGFGRIAKRIRGVNKDLESQDGLIRNFITGIKNFATVSEDEISSTITRLSKAISDQPFPTTPIGEVENATGTGRTADLLRRILEAQRRLREAEARRNLQVDLNSIEERKNALQEAVAQELITEREAFQVRRELLREQTNLQLSAIQAQINAENEIAREQRARILNDPSIEAAEKRQQIELLNAQSATRIAQLDQRRLGIQQRLNNALSQQNVQLEQARRTTERLLEQQTQELDTFFVETIGDRLDALILQQQNRLRELRNTPGVTNEQIQQQIELNQLQQLQTAIATPVNAALNAIQQAFTSLVNGIVDGSLNFRDVARDISRTLIQGGLQDLVNEAKEALVDGIEKIFDGLSNEAAQRAASALAAGIGLLFAVLSRAGNEGSFTATGGSGGGVGIDSSAAVRGIIGGDTSIPIAEINNGLQEALIPTNNILSQIERNTRAFAGLNIGLTPEDIANTITQQINDLFDQVTLSP